MGPRMCVGCVWHVCGMYVAHMAYMQCRWRGHGVWWVGIGAHQGMEHSENMGAQGSCLVLQCWCCWVHACNENSERMGSRARAWKSHGVWYGQ